MTLPRLRVRELLFLVVYAALIGQAFVLSLAGPELPTGLRTPPDGYVWVQFDDLHAEFRGTMTLEGVPSAAADVLAKAAREVAESEAVPVVRIKDALLGINFFVLVSGVTLGLLAAARYILGG